MENIKVLNKKAFFGGLSNDVMNCDKCSEQPCVDMIFPCKSSDFCPIECEIPICGSRDVAWKLGWKNSF